MQDKFIGFIIMLAALATVLLIGALKKRAEWLLTFLLRSVTGTVLIYFANLLIASTNMGFEIGILGFPGVLLLYGINLVQIL